METVITFIDPSGDYFWTLESAEHVHDMRTGRCLKNRAGALCGTTKSLPRKVLDKALDFLAARL